MGTIAKVTAGGATHLVASTAYGTCYTAAATAAKVATIQDSQAFTLVTGITVHIKFTYANGVANPTLNVNNTGAIAIMRYGTTRPSTSASESWGNGSVVSFTYDGTYWQMNDWMNTNTWRPIKVNGTQILGTSTGTGLELNLKSGNGVTVTRSTNDVFFNCFTTVTCTLATSMTLTGQTVTVTGVTASNTVIVGPAPASQDVYVAAGIKCTAQAANSLTFTATSAPTAPVTVNVMIFG